LIHDRIDQCIEQVIGSGLPQPSSASTKAVPHWYEDVGPVFLEGQNKVSAEDETHLFDNDILSVGHGEHLQDEKQAGLIVVEFWALIGVGNVFKEQGMELELFSERFQDFHLVDAADIHPCDGLIGRWCKLIERQDLVFVAAEATVVEGRKRNLVRFFLADMDKGTRGEPRLSGSFLD